MSKKSISKEERLAQRQEYERAALIAEETFFELFKQGMPVFACDDYFEEGQHFVNLPLEWEQPMKQFFQTHESYLLNILWPILTFRAAYTLIDLVISF